MAVAHKRWTVAGQCTLLTLERCDFPRLAGSRTAAVASHLSHGMAQIQADFGAQLQEGRCSEF